VAVIEETVYLLGGSADVDCKHPSNEVVAWSQQGVKLCKPMSAERARHSVVASKTDRRSYIFAIGGIGSTEKPTGRVEKLNVESDIWQELPSLTIARTNAGACIARPPSLH